MALSTELISQFAKVITPKETRPEFTTVTGRAKLYDGKMYVQIDGSNGQLTPIASSTVGLKDNDWVTVQIKNHSATVTGNATDPSAGTSYADDIKDQVDNVSDQISEFEIVIADKVDVDVVNAISGRIDDLVSENVTITGKLDAAEAEIDDLQADNVTITGKLEAAEGDIDHLESSKADISVLESDYATIKNLEATNANIHNLEADYGSFKDLTTDNFTAVNGSITNLEANKLDVTEADIKYANIDFSNIGVAAVEELFAKSGIIEDLVVSGSHITGELVGVTIKGDLIEGNTIKADKLVVLGEDGLYYKLNVGAETVAAQQTQYNSLNGSIITANTITAEKINVDDLVAFNATIGGYHISDGSLYSGAKSSVSNTTRGVYMGDDGQFAVGDNDNYLKFFNDNGAWKLEISAASIKMGGSSTTIEEEITNIKNDVTNAGKIMEKSCGEIISIGENGGITPYSLTVYGATVESNSVDELSVVTAGKNLLLPFSENSEHQGVSLTVDSDAQTFSVHGTNTGAAVVVADLADAIEDVMSAARSARLKVVTNIPIVGDVYFQINTTDLDGTNSVMLCYVGTTQNISLIDLPPTKKISNIFVAVQANATVDFDDLWVAIVPEDEDIVEHPLYEEIVTTPIDLDGYTLSSSSDGTRDELIVDRTGAVTLIQRVGVAEENPIELPSVELPPLPPSSANVWLDTPVPTTACVEYWTVEGVLVADAQMSADSAQSDADESLERINSAEIEIDSINSTIQTIVVGEDGKSMMVQTEDGWRFDISSIQSAVDSATEDISTINGDLSSLGTIVEQANTTLNAVTEKTAYINMSTDDMGAPCIELGKQDNDFKLRITNTSIDFMQGTQKIAYISNHQLYIQSSVVTDEMKIGYPSGYIWKKRGNNHMGLRWVTS